MPNERRSYPRHPVQCAVTVTVPDAADVFPAVSMNISRTSIQIQCNADLLAALVRQSRLPHVCELRFVLPDHEHEFRLDTSLVTQRRVAQHQYVLVLLFRHEDPAQENLLERLLQQKQPVGLD